MGEPISVFLDGKQVQAIQERVYRLVTDSVETAKRDAGISQKWLRKGQAATYAGVSPNTYAAWVRQGLPCHVIHGITLFAKSDIDFYILHNGIIK